MSRKKHLLHFQLHQEERDHVHEFTNDWSDELIIISYKIWFVHKWFHLSERFTEVRIRLVHELFDSRRIIFLIRRTTMNKPPLDRIDDWIRVFLTESIRWTNQYLSRDTFFCHFLNESQNRIRIVHCHILSQFIPSVFSTAKCKTEMWSQVTTFPEIFMQL